MLWAVSLRSGEVPLTEQPWTNWFIRVGPPYIAGPWLELEDTVGLQIDS